MYNVTFRCVHATIVVPVKKLSVTHSERVSLSLALVIQHAKQVHHIMSPAACVAQQYFTTLSHKWHIFGKKVQNIKCVF